MREKILKILKNPLTWIISLGFSFRFYGVKNFPVLHDEIMSILDGVNKTRESLLHFFYIASLENTLGVMPFYFWIERLFTDIFGQNNWGLRIFPLLMGTISIYLIYYIVKKRFDRNLAILSAFLVAFSDIFIWVTSKAQFFEVILIPLSFLAFFFLTSENKKKFYWASFCFTLMLFTYFGKGLFLLICFFIWYFLIKIFELKKLKIKPKEIISSTKKELLQFSSFFLIPLVWIFSVQFLVFKKGPIFNVTGLGEIKNIWEILNLTTFSYGIKTKQFLIGTPRDAFLVFDNIHVWPVTSLLFIPFLFGLLILIYQTFSHWRKGSVLFKRDIYLLTFGLVPFLFVISKGIISERFHLLYFLPFVIISSLGLFNVPSFLPKNKAIYFLFLLALGIYGSYVSSWKNWYYQIFDWEKFYEIFGAVFLVIFLYFIFYYFVKINERTLIRTFWIGFLSLLIIINLFFGPLVWGLKAAWNPASDNKLAPAPGYYLEGDEKEVINFALQKNNPKICDKLPLNWKNQCLNQFK